MSFLRNIFDNLEDHSSDKWAPYFDVYERHLKNISGTDITLVEVGTQKGGSLDMWGTYFGSGSNIIGIDIDPECEKLTYANPNIGVYIGDQGNPEFWDNFLKDRPNIDVFIDDGGHFMDQQILTFEKVFPHISPGGIYICEDCHTSYMAYNGGGLERKNTFINYAKLYIDVMHYNWKESTTSELEMRRKIGKDISSIHFYDSMVVFEKFEMKEMKRVFPKKFNNS